MYSPLRNPRAQTLLHGVVTPCDGVDNKVPQLDTFLLCFLSILGVQSLTQGLTVNRKYRICVKNAVQYQIHVTIAPLINCTTVNVQMVLPVRVTTC